MVKCRWCGKKNPENEYKVTNANGRTLYMCKACESEIPTENNPIFPKRKVYVRDGK